MVGCGGLGVSPDVLYEQWRTEYRRGNLGQAFVLAERGYQKWGSQLDTKPGWQFRIAKASTLAAQGKPRDALPFLEGQMPARPSFRELAVRRVLAEASARTLLTDFGTARQRYEEAARLATALPSGTVHGDVALVHGNLLSVTGDSAGAEESYRKVLEIGVTEGDLRLQTAGKAGLGFIRLKSGRYDEALPWFEQALALAEKGGAQVGIAGALGNLGRCYYGLGDSEKAIPMLKRAADLAGEVGDLYRKQGWLGALGDEFLYKSGDPIRAKPYFREALALAKQMGERVSETRWQQSLAEAALKTGDLASAEKYNAEALRLSRDLQERSLTTWATLQRATIDLAKKDYARAERGFREALAAASTLEDRDAVWEAHSALGRMYAEMRRPEEAEREFQVALAALEATRTKLARDAWKLSFQSGAKEFYQSYVDFLMDRGETERALEVVEWSRARLLAQKLGILQKELRPAGAARFRGLTRAHNAALVSVWLAPKRSFVWVVTSRKVHAAVLPGEAEINAAARAYAGAIESLRDPLETENPAGRRLSEILLAPVAAQVSAGSRVILVADGALNEVNLESLPAPGGRPRYWLEDVTLAVAPSLTLVGNGGRVRRAQRDSLLLIGNPVVPNSEFPPLPDAEKEVESLRRRFPGARGTVLSGEAATPDAYEATGPGRFSLIHFSAHAVGNRENPLESAVILSRKGETYKLYAREVIGVPLKARLVTISACRGAGARVYSGEGLVGFAWAFLEAGAQNVIAGLWDVNDRSTAVLMDHLYAGLAAGRAPAMALRAAKLKLLNSGGAYRKPYYWAPFEVFARTPAF
jgi:CHAT domain-containing protein